MNAPTNRLAGLAAVALCAAAAAPPALTPLTHSTLVTVDAAVDAGTLILRVRRSADQRPAPVTDLGVTLDGRALPVTPRPDGTWGAALGRAGETPGGTLAITVAHDGVRELLTAKLRGSAAAAGGSAAGRAATLLGVHKQLAWWVLNIAVVLIGVIAVSRRMS